MGSYTALPALSIHPYNEQPIDMFSKLMALKNMAFQQKLQPLELQQEQARTAIAQQQMKDIQTLQSIGPKYIQRDDQGKATGFDYDGFTSEASGAGVSPAMLNQLATLRKTSADALQAQANAGKINLDNENTKNDQARQKIEAVKGLDDPNQRNQAWQQSLKWAQGHGMDISNWPMAAPDNDTLDKLEMPLAMRSQSIKEAQETQQTATSKAQQGEAEATTAKTQAEMQGSVGQFADARYRNILSAISAGKNVSDDDLAFAKGYELQNRKTSTSSDTLGVVSSNTSQPSGLAAAMGNRKGGKFVAPGSAPQSPTPTAGQPSGAGASPAPPQQSTRDSIVDLIGQYKADPQLLSRMMYKHPEILGVVNAKYPDFDQTTYAAKNKLIQGYTSGSQSKEINAINTVAGHLDALDQAVSALNNGNVQVLNKVANSLGAQVGQTPQTTFQTIVHRIGPEITSAYIPGAGGEAERLANAKDFSENLSPDQLHTNIQTTVGLLRSKLGALENQYKQTVGRDDFQTRFITPAAQASFGRLGGAQQGGGQPPVAPGKFDWNSMPEHR